MSQSLETPCLSCALHLTVNTAGGVWRKVRLSSEGGRDAAALCSPSSFSPSSVPTRVSGNQYRLPSDTEALSRYFFVDSI